MPNFTFVETMPPNNKELIEEEHNFHVISELVFAMHLFYNQKYFAKMKIPIIDDCAKCDWAKDGMHNYLQKVCVHFHKYFFFTFQYTLLTKNEDKIVFNYRTELSKLFDPYSLTEPEVFSKFMFICAAFSEYDLFCWIIKQPPGNNYSSVDCLVSIFKDKFESHFSNLGGWEELENICLKWNIASSIENSLRPLEMRNIDHFLKGTQTEDLLFVLSKFNHFPEGNLVKDSEKELRPKKLKVSKFIKRLFFVIEETVKDKSKSLQYLHNIAVAVIQFLEYYKKTFRLVFEKCFPNIPKRRFSVDYIFFKQCAFSYIHGICLNKSVYEFVTMCAFAFELQHYINSKPGKKLSCVQEVLVDVLVEKFGGKCAHLQLYLARIHAVCEGISNGIHMLADDSLNQPSSLMIVQSLSLQERLHNVITAVEKGELKYMDMKTEDGKLAQDLVNLSLEDSLDESTAMFILIINEYQSTFSLPACWDVSLLNDMYENNSHAFEFAKSLKSGIQQFCACLRKYFRVLFELDRPDLMKTQDDLSHYLLCRSLLLTDNPTKFAYHTTHAFMSEVLVYFMRKNKTITFGNVDILVSVASKSFHFFLQERFSKTISDSWKEFLQCYSLGICSKIYAVDFENSSKSCDADIRVKERKEAQLVKTNLTKFILPVSLPKNT